MDLKGPQPLGFEKTAESQHFKYFWNPVHVNKEELDTAFHFCEQIYERMAKALGKDRMTAKKLIVTFNGEGLVPNRPKRAPNVDRYGRIHLYRFNDGGYFAAFAHELVHAIRVTEVANWERFFEEGVASAFSDLIYPEKMGFPLFGYPRAQIAAYLLQRPDNIPLQIMREKHLQLNMKCQLQSYILREDFFCYLIEKYGSDKLINFAYSNEVGQLNGYESTWGHSFDKLIQDWEQHLKTLYPFEQIETLGQEYLQNTPAKYIPICDE